MVRWACETAFARMQQAREGLYRNLRLPGLGGLLAWPGGLWARLTRFGAGPDDATGQRLARAIQQPGAQRDRITGRIHVPNDPHEALGRLEHALQLCTDADPVLKKLKDAVRAGRLPKARPEQLLDQAVERGIVSDAERQLVRDAEVARAEAVAVDSFTLAEYAATAVAQDELAVEPR